jgi:hypothetical protein
MMADGLVIGLQMAAAFSAAGPDDRRLMAEAAEALLRAQVDEERRERLERTIAARDARIGELNAELEVKAGLLRRERELRIANGARAKALAAALERIRASHTTGDTTMRIARDALEGR